MELDRRAASERLGCLPGGKTVDQERRSAERYQINGAIVFYRREQEPVEREHLGILKNIGPGGLLLATGEALAAGAVLLMRIYSQVAPPGHSEVMVRGIVQRFSQDPKGVGIRFLDTAREQGNGGLQGLLKALSPAFRSAPAYAVA
jgi:hypothetical protein